MPIDRKNLTEEQQQALDRAAMKIINAHREAAQIIEGSGVPYELPGSHCTGETIDHGGCPCRYYEGNGGPCEFKYTIVSGDVPFEVLCGHPPSKHLEF